MPKRRQTIYLDEHIDPVVKEIFANAGFRCIRITESRYRGKDEHDYIADLYAERAVFVTSDQRFIEHVASGDIRHAGIIWIPSVLYRSEKELLAVIIAGYMAGHELRQMRGMILFLAHDGLRLTDGDDDELVASFPTIRRDFAALLKQLGARDPD